MSTKNNATSNNATSNNPTSIAQRRKTLFTRKVILNIIGVLCAIVAFVLAGISTENSEDEKNKVWAITILTILGITLPITQLLFFQKLQDFLGALGSGISYAGKGISYAGGGIKTGVQRGVQYVSGITGGCSGVRIPNIHGEM